MLNTVLAQQGPLQPFREAGKPTRKSLGSGDEPLSLSPSASCRDTISSNEPVSYSHRLVKLWEI